MCTPNFAANIGVYMVFDIKTEYVHEDNMSKEEEVQSISILVATPAFNSMMYTAYAASIHNFHKACRSRNINVSHTYTFNESLITRARNAVCDLFMQHKKFTHLLFLDADIEFESDDIFKLLNFNQPVVGGLYPKKNIKWENIAEFVNKNHKSYVSISDIQHVSREYVFVPTKDHDTDNELIKEFAEVRYTGTGILLVQRHVLEKMMESHSNDYYTNENTKFFRFFDVGLKWVEEQQTNVYLSEDYWFCERWRELGGKIYLYTKMRCKHWGSMAY
jgi:hypothetical protein